MANYTSLKAAIDNAIKTNGNKEITGSVLNQTLNAMVNSLGVGYQFAGMATPSTNPGTPDQNVFYFATQAGTYSNFNNIVLPDGISILSWNGSWSSSTLSYSEGVFDISAYHATGGTLAKYADLTAALGTSGANIPEPIRKGGMSVKFVLSSDNKYVQARLMANSFTTDITAWQVVSDRPAAGSEDIATCGALYDIAQYSGDNLLILNYVADHATGGGMPQTFEVIEGRNYIFQNSAESSTLCYLTFQDENHTKIGSDTTVAAGVTSVIKAPVNCKYIKIAAFDVCYVTIKLKSILNEYMESNTQKVEQIDAETKVLDSEIKTINGSPLVDEEFAVSSSVVHVWANTFLKKDTPFRVEVNTSALSHIALYFFNSNDQEVGRIESLISDFPRIYTPTQDVTKVKISVNSTVFIIQPGDVSVSIYNSTSLKETVETQIAGLNNAIYNPVICDGSYGVAPGYVYNKVFDCKVAPYKKVALFVQSAVVNYYDVRLIAEDNTEIYPVEHSASANYKPQVSPFIFNTGDKRIKGLRIAIWNGTFITATGTVNFSLCEINNIISADGGKCITDTLNATSASSAQIAYDKTLGLVGVASMGGWKVYGETRDKIMLDIFSPENPSEVRHKVLISKGDAYGDGYVYNSTTDLDIILISSGVWRVIISGFNGFMYIDYNYNTDTISSPVEIKASIGGELVSMNDTNRRAYCTSKGYTDTTSTNGTLSSNFYQDGNGRIYGCWTAESPEERTSYPVCFYSDDNMETIVPFAVYPVDCNYEASIVKLDSKLYILSRKYDDTYSYGVSEDNGDNWVTNILNVGSDNRPRLYNLDGTLYWCYGLLSQYNDIRYGKRTRISIKVGNDITQAKEVMIESPNGVSYFCLLKVYNEFYLIYSSAPLRLDVANGVRENSWGKDAVFIKKIDI